MIGGPHYLAKDEYRNAAGVSTSQLKRFAACPEDTKYTEPTAAMLFGTRLENLVFGSDATFVVKPESIKVRRGKEWEAFKAENSDADIVTDAELYALMKAYRQIEVCQVAKQLLTTERYWPSFSWTCPVTGMLRKGELDVLQPQCIVDLKTTADPSPAAFAAQAERLKYHWQAASYQEAVELNMGQRLPVVFVCVRNSDPWNVEVLEMPQDWIDEGLREVRVCSRRYLEAKNTGKWRSPTWGQIVAIQRPRWARYASEYDFEEVEV